MATKTILVADDEARMRDLIKMYLEADAFTVREASSGDQALEIVRNETIDLLLLDIMMPGLDGLAVCREIRQTTDLPIVMVTARGDELDRILGFELGADDYIVKPFSPRELVARVKALLRRSTQGPSERGALKAGVLVIDPSSRKVTSDGRVITLTPKEYDLLWFLANRPGKVFTRELLLEQVWGYTFFGSLRTVDTHIKRLREKLADGPAQDYISTIWGVGYKFEVE